MMHSAHHRFQQARNFEKPLQPLEPETLLSAKVYIMILHENTDVHDIEFVFSFTRNESVVLHKLTVSKNQQSQ